MITFEKKGDILIFVLSIDNEEYFNDISKRIVSNDDIAIKNRIFTFKNGDQYLENIENSYGFVVKFIIGRMINEYYKIDSRVLSIEHDLYIHRDVECESDLFIATKNISIFKKISGIINSDIYIGGSHAGFLPENEFRLVIKNFPNNYEITKYVNARLSAVLRNYFDLLEDHEKKYDQYLNKKPSIHGEDIRSKFLNVDLEKYSNILEKLQIMLENEDQYNEENWQKEILQIILLLYPKYITVFEKTPVIEEYTGKRKQLDYLLVDSGGHTDIIEIKKPSCANIVSLGTYRDNHIPLRELSGAVMQVEKYIFYLNKWGKKGEEMLTNKYKKDLPADFKIMITNPGGIIIMGRGNKFKLEQKCDFEVIRRKYKNIIDIITYDDLLERLNSIINRLTILSKK